MTRRDAAYTRLTDYLDLAHADPSRILEDAAGIAARVLADSTDPTNDVEAGLALGHYHWFRSLALPEEQAANEVSAAIRYLAPFGTVHPDVVPVPLRAKIPHGAAPAPGVLAAALHSCGVSLLTSHQRTGHPHYLVRAVDMIREAGAVAPVGDPDRTGYLGNLRVALMRLYQNTQQLALLREAIRCEREALWTLSPHHPERVRHVDGLSTVFGELIERTGDAALHGDAVETAREAVNLTPTHDPRYADRLNNLGIALFRLYRTTEELDTLRESVEYSRRAIAAVPRDHPGYPGMLSNLANALGILHRRTGEVAAIEQAADVSRAAVAAAPRGNPLRYQCLSNLTETLRILYERIGHGDVLDEAIRTGREAVGTAPRGGDVHAAALVNLGLALRALFMLNGDPAALDEAVRIAREVVAVTPPDHPEYAESLDSLSTELQLLFEATGDLPALQEAIDVSRRAVRAGRQGGSGHVRRQDNLASALRLLCERTGDAAALEEAVDIWRRIADSGMPRVLHNSALGLDDLYRYRGDLALLKEAVSAERRAVAETPEDDPELSVYLDGLGSRLILLHSRSSDIELAKEAVRVGRRAVAATPPDHADHAGYLGNLGSALKALGIATRDRALLAEAAQTQRRAVAVGPPDHPSRLIRLSNLGVTLRDLFAVTEDDAYLDEAIEVGRAAVAGTPAGDPYRAVRLNNAGEALHIRFERQARNEDLDEACGYLFEAGHMAMANVQVRIAALRRYAAMTQPHAPRLALTTLETAIDLIESLAPASLGQSDREHRLAEIGGLAGEAAASALAADDPRRAVQLLERARGILAAEVLDSRSEDVTRLYAQHPELGMRFDFARTEITLLNRDERVADSAGPSASTSDRQLSELRRNAYDTWQALLAEIRGLPGFAEFFRAPAIEDLSALTHDGPVVFISISPARCDALVLTDDPRTPVDVVRLPLLTEEAAVENVGRLWRARSAPVYAAAPASRELMRADRSGGQQEVLAVLSWLWDSVVEPVLTRLGHTAEPGPGQPWPRVWWCPIGLLAFLPLHAAGHYSLDPADPTPQGPTALDRVVSSYTTTVRALRHVRGRATSGEPAPRTLIVPVPDTPGAPLPGVTEETSAITALIPDAQLLPAPTRAEVLKLLPQNQIVHFACHGVSDQDDPARSRLILTDHEIAPLTVAEISALELDASLAYLSACDTSVTTPRLVNEALHITGAFQLGGFRHVIGTLWPIDDHAAAQFAEDFYDFLTKSGAASPQPDRSADALHCATARMRARHAGSPTLWAGYLHFGS